jgi:catechol 2,3-dioxygenase-like lactoylglutathione lyase family enzyme
MIQRMSHTTIWVTDQDVALDFYVNKLGFEVRTDVTMDGGFRWLTVGPKGQPDLEIVLMLVKPGAQWDDETTELVRKLLAKGALGAGAFETPDCRKTYEELKGRGVEFMSEPEEKFYGVEAILKDPFGNWFSMTQHK